MNWLKAALDFLIGVKNAIASFRKDNPKLDKNVIVGDVAFGVDVAIQVLPDVKKILDQNFASKKDDAVLVQEIAKALAPKFPAAADAERLAGFVIALSNLGIIRS